MEYNTFFANNEMRSAVSNFLRTLREEDYSSEFEMQIIKHLTNIFVIIRNNPENWDENCQANISWIGDNLYDHLRSTQNKQKEQLEQIFAYAYRFLVEMEISSNINSPEINSVHDFVNTNLSIFPASISDQIKFAESKMPTAILKTLFSSEHIRSIKNISKIKEYEKEIELTWSSEIKEKEDRINKLKEALDKYEIAFNFVGLYNGFDNLAKEKIIEKSKSAFWLKIFGPLILAPSAIEIAAILTHIDDIEKAKNILLLTAIPAVSATLLIIYFFRIFLSNFNSTKSQLLQIDLRKTLCAFIQSYTSYSSEIKAKDKDSLEKFENIIFSGLVSDENKIPSTFDGMEQISSLIKTIRS